MTAARPCAEIRTVDSKNEKPLFTRFYLPLSLVAAHALLAALLAYIGLGPGYDDRNYTYLVVMTIRFLDYPVFALLDLIDRRMFQMSGNVFPLSLVALVALVGSLYWFVIGCVLQWVIRRLRDFVDKLH